MIAISLNDILYIIPFFLDHRPLIPWQISGWKIIVTHKKTLNKKYKHICMHTSLP